jgi:ubiquitin-protein ligase E3 A
VTYKLLLGEKPDLQDLIEAQPELGRGLQQLLDFDGDVEATFARDFTYSYESYGEMKVVELKENGANIPVTNANRVEFVQLYVDYVLSKSIKKQFGAFHKGFLAACGGDALQLFRPFELEQLICGSGDLDFEALESTTRYEDGYTKDSPICKQFWEIVHTELSLEDKKKLLEFATGSDRVPIRGLASMQLTISRQGPDSEQLPTSHTCFNHLLIPEYSTKEKLRTFLARALQHSKGFGLI